jgi:predicted amidohydrolase YtcJ
MVLYNGKVLTADDKFTMAEAVAIRDGKFLAVGKTDAILPMAGPQTRKIDLKGKTEKQVAKNSGQP